MRRNLVEQQQAGATFRGQRGMRQRHRDQHRLLFAGRALRGRHALGRMDDIELVAMRPRQRALRRTVAPAIVEQRLRQAIGMPRSARGVC